MLFGCISTNKCGDWGSWSNGLDELVFLPVNTINRILQDWYFDFLLTRMGDVTNFYSWDNLTSNPKFSFSTKLKSSFNNKIPGLICHSWLKRIGQTIPHCVKLNNSHQSITMFATYARFACGMLKIMRIVKPFSFNVKAVLWIFF